MKILQIFCVCRKMVFKKGLACYKKEVTTNRGDVYKFESFFPEVNPPDALKDIVDCFELWGLFESIKK